MIEAGLLIAGDDIPVPYDRFRDRVIFPISDLRGRIIAFGGRALDPEAPAKYLNSPETPLFHKGATLYNGAAARQAAHDGAQVIAVEGYVDVIAMVTAGYPATVAPLGTSLTEDQLALMWKMADEPLLLFDGDAAGRRAAYRAVDLAMPKLQPGKSLKFATLPEGQDPDDLFRSGGSTAIAEVLAGAEPLAAVLWRRETETAQFDTPERRAGLEARLGEVLAAIGHEAVRKYYRQDIDERLRALFAPVAAAASARGGGAPFRKGERRWNPGGAGRPQFGSPPQLTVVSQRLATSAVVRGGRSVLPPREALILVAVINHPWLLTTHAEELAELEFNHGDANTLRRAILDAGAGHDAIESQALRAAIAARGLGTLLARIEGALTHASDWPARPDAAPGDVGPWWTHIIALHRKTRTLNKELKDAERALAEDPSEQNLARLRDVQSQLADLNGSEAQIDGFGALSGRPARNL